MKNWRGWHASVSTTKMKVGDLVRYRGWTKSPDSGPLALVVDETQRGDSDYHKRVRVSWLGEEIPVQASVISTSGTRISMWVHPKYFEVVSESSKEDS